MIDLSFIFPTPIGFTDRETTEDYSSLLDLPLKRHPSNLFEQTEDNYVLDSHCPELKQWLEAEINEYAKLALCIKQPLKITQSWLIMHQPGVPQHIYTHRHPNSIVSGSYYIEADNAANLRFDRNEVSSAPYIEWGTNEEDLKDAPWNYAWQAFPVRKNRLILFPSQISHGVSGPASEAIRCSLSFNTWFVDSRWGVAEYLGEVDYNK